MKNFGILLCALFFASPSLCQANSVEQSLINAGCGQSRLSYVIAHDAKGITSCIDSGEKVLAQSVVPSADRIQDLLAFRVRLILKTCDIGSDTVSEQDCLNNSALELQKSYAQNDLDITTAIQSCPLADKYWSKPGANAEFNLNCTIDKMKSIAKIN